MSLYRVGRGKRPVVRPKKAAPPKREWVSTINDLSVHKLTPEEVSRRHELHRSQNRAVAHWELKERALRRRQKISHPNSPPPLDHASLRVIREVFSEQLQLQDVLARSDRAMAVVKDLFGDAPHRQTGFPSVTMAPDGGSDCELPVRQRPEPPTQLSLLSQSMVDTQALNERDGSEDGHSGEMEPVRYRSIKHPHRVDPKLQRSRVKQPQRTLSTFGQQRAADSLPQTPCGSGGDSSQAALNATVAVQRLTSGQRRTEWLDSDEPSPLVTQVLNSDPTPTCSGKKEQSSKVRRRLAADSAASGLHSSTLTSLGGNQASLGGNQTSLRGNQTSLGQLHGMLDQVAAELDSVGSEEPLRESPGSQQSTNSLGGFSLALVSTLGRLAHLHTQREEETRREVRERRRLEEEVKEQRGLIDALTTETLTLREENASLQAEMQVKTWELEQRLDAVVLALAGTGLLGGDLHVETQHSNSSVKDVPWQAGSAAEASWQAGSAAEAPWQAGLVADGQRQAGLVADGQRQAGLVADDQWRAGSASPAMLLSPPRQRHSQQHIYADHSLPLQQQIFLLNQMGSLDRLQTPSPPIPSEPSHDALLAHRAEPPTPSELSQDALLSQIGDLMTQNAQIRDQLVRPRGQRSGVSPRGESEMKGGCSSSTGRRTPPDGQGRRPSAASSTERASLSGAEHQLTQQAVLPEGSGVSSVEQRLLELSRQSAAARSRLLELIEQQKHSGASTGVSPSVSPIPAHISPNRPLSPDTGPLVGLEKKPDKVDIKGDRMKGKGWFALSTHVR